MHRGPESLSGHPAAEERERPISLPPDSTREVEHEDFLFHLYRGSELLQDNRVLEAKEELEFALTMRPLDSKGQDLLGAVYFRLGLYPRAIHIYEDLEAQFPRDASIKINLALCYLKTGQPEPARRALHEVVEIQPDHKRAWGYLGLALRKLGDIEAAQVALERGGHAQTAKRMVSQQDEAVAAGGGGAANVEVDGQVRSVAETAFSELDAGELQFALAQPEASRPGDEPWHTVEFGGPKTPKTKSQFRATLPPPSLRGSALGAGGTMTPAEAAPASLSLAPSAGGVSPETATTQGLAPELLALPPNAVVGLHPSGSVVVRAAIERAFAARLDSLRVVAGSVSTRVLHTRTREGEAAEVLGGIGSALVQITGDAHLVFGPRAAHCLAIVPLDDELAFVREDVLIGFDGTLVYENGRLALDASAEGTPVVQLRGSGAVVLELVSGLHRIPCLAGSPLLVRREWVVGWTGRLLPRALPPGESLSGQRGLISFAGEGAVLVVCAGERT